MIIVKAELHSLQLVSLVQGYSASSDREVLHELYYFMSGFGFLFSYFTHFLTVSCDLRLSPCSPSANKSMSQAARAAQAGDRAEPLTTVETTSSSQRINPQHTLSLLFKVSKVDRFKQENSTQNIFLGVFHPSMLWRNFQMVSLVQSLHIYRSQHRSQCPALRATCWKLEVGTI